MRRRTRALLGLLLCLVAASARAQTRSALKQDFADQNANQCLCGPTSGGATTPGFRAFVAADIPDVSATYALASRTLTAGSGLTGGGTLAADRTFTVGAGTCITANADDVAVTDACVNAATLGGVSSSGFVQTSRAVNTNNGLSGGGTLAADRTISGAPIWAVLVHAGAGGL
jgi:hypothetical protein